MLGSTTFDAEIKDNLLMNYFGNSLDVDRFNESLKLPCTIIGMIGFCFGIAYLIVHF